MPRAEPVSSVALEDLRLRVRSSPPQAPGGLEHLGRGIHPSLGAGLASAPSDVEPKADISGKPARGGSHEPLFLSTGATMTPHLNRFPHDRKRSSNVERRQPRFRLIRRWPQPRAPRRQRRVAAARRHGARRRSGGSIRVKSAGRGRAYQLVDAAGCHPRQLPFAQIAHLKPSQDLSLKEGLCGMRDQYLPRFRRAA